MDMVLHTTDRHGFHSVLARNTAEKRPKPFAQRGRDLRAASFGAEDAMKIGADVRHRDIQPSLRDFCNAGLGPGVETPGYYHNVPSGLGLFALCSQLKRWAIVTRSLRDHCPLHASRKISVTTRHGLLSVMRCSWPLWW